SQAGSKAHRPAALRRDLPRTVKRPKGAGRGDECCPGEVKRSGRGARGSSGASHSPGQHSPPRPAPPKRRRLIVAANRSAHLLLLRLVRLIREHPVPSPPRPLPLGAPDLLYT